MSTRSTLKRAALIVPAVALFTHELGAQPYPTKPVRFIVASSAGSGTDVIARIVANGMTAAMNQQVVVDHRAGAGGNIAAEIVAKSPPDGYTLLVVMVSHAANVSLYRKLQYRTYARSRGSDAIRDITASARRASFAACEIGVRAGETREGEAGAINYASATPGTSSFLAGELFKTLAGVNLVNVPYRGGGDVLTAVVSGETAVSFPPVATSLPQVRRGSLRALAVSSSKRLPVMPDTPTVAEAGVRNYQFGNWYGLMAPAKTPADTIAAIHTAALSALNRPDTRERLVELGYIIVGDTPREFTAHIRSEVETFGKLIRQTGIKID